MQKGVNGLMGSGGVPKKVQTYDRLKKSAQEEKIGQQVCWQCGLAG